MSHSLRYALFNWGSQSEKTGFEESRQNKSEGALLSWLLVVIHYRDSSVWRDHLPRACKKSCTAAFYPPAAIPHWSLPTSPGYTCVVGTGPTASLHSATTKELPKRKRGAVKLCLHETDHFGRGWETPTHSWVQWLLCSSNRSSFNHPSIHIACSVPSLGIQRVKGTVPALKEIVS